MWSTEEVSRELLAILPFINRIMAADLRLEAGEETTMPQFRVLAALAEQPLTQSAIARWRRVSLQAAGELIQILVDRGWVTRVADPHDRRQMLLHLTDEGRQQYQRAQNRMLTHLVPLMTQLTPEETAALQVTLSALRRVFAPDENMEDDSP